MSGERKNNPADMSIMEQIEAIKTEVCDKICIFRQQPKLLDEEDAEAQERLYIEHCNECPLTRL